MQELESMMPPISKSFMHAGVDSWSPENKRDSVMLFNGCVMSTVFADTNRATGRVLAHNGASVTVPAKQQCCGALQVHSGQMAEARVLAKTNIAAFESSGAEKIVVNAAGCGAALKEYGFLLKDDSEFAERAHAFSERIVDVTEYLGGIDLIPPSKEVKRRVTYQEPCHLAHAQRITEQPRKLLASISGVELIEMRESSLCCGSAGIYNIIRREMANELGDRKVENAIATDAEEVITANPGCAMQLRASLLRNGSEMKVRHIVDLLDEAYGGQAVEQNKAWAVDQKR
jgi:glycolate oxidase iron-sulfur subunit